MPICCGEVIREITPAMITPDIEPFQTIAADKKTGKLPIIRSRKQHREFLARNDYRVVEDGEMNIPAMEELRDRAPPGDGGYVDYDLNRDEL